MFGNMGTQKCWGNMGQPRINHRFVPPNKSLKKKKNPGWWVGKKTAANSGAKNCDQGLVVFSFSPLSGSQSSFTVRASIQEVGKFPCAAWGGKLPGKGGVSRWLANWVVDFLFLGLPNTCFLQHFPF